MRKLKFLSPEVKRRVYCLNDTPFSPERIEPYIEQLNEVLSNRVPEIAKQYEKCYYSYKSPKLTNPYNKDYGHIIAKPIGKLISLFNIKDLMENLKPGLYISRPLELYASQPYIMLEKNTTEPIIDDIGPTIIISQLIMNVIQFVEMINTMRYTKTEFQDHANIWLYLERLKINV